MTLYCAPAKNIVLIVTPCFFSVLLDAWVGQFYRVDCPSTCLEQEGALDGWLDLLHSYLSHISFPVSWGPTNRRLQNFKRRCFTSSTELCQYANLHLCSRVGGHPTLQNGGCTFGTDPTVDQPVLLHSKGLTIDNQCLFYSYALSSNSHSGGGFNATLHEGSHTVILVNLFIRYSTLDVEHVHRFVSMLPRRICACRQSVTKI